MCLRRGFVGGSERVEGKDEYVLCLKRSELSNCSLIRTSCQSPRPTRSRKPYAHFVVVRVSAARQRSKMAYARIPATQLPTEVRTNQFQQHLYIPRVLLPRKSSPRLRHLSSFGPQIVRPELTWKSHDYQHIKSVFCGVC